MRFGGLEILVIFAIVLLFFGPKQIPKLTSTLKDAIKNFKEGSTDEEKNETILVDDGDVKGRDEA